MNVLYVLYVVTEVMHGIGGQPRCLCFPQVLSCKPMLAEKNQASTDFPFKTGVTLLVNGLVV